MTLPSDNIGRIKPAGRPYGRFKMLSCILFLMAATLAWTCSNFYHLANMMAFMGIVATFTIPVIILALLIFHRMTVSPTGGAELFKSLVPYVVLSIIAWSYALLFIINIHYDKEQPSTHQQRVLDKRYTSGRDSLHYYFTVTDWHGGGEGFEVGTDKTSIYDSYQTGDMLDITSHPGALGGEWIEAINANPSQSSTRETTNNMQETTQAETAQMPKTPAIEMVDTASMIAIPIHEMMEFNFKTKQEMYELRKAFVASQKQFIGDNYKPSDDIFGQIQDGKPWWGILGKSYYGPGEKSISGPAEESRYLTNPLLLVGLDNGKAFIVRHKNIEPLPIYPIPLSLYWGDGVKEAVVKYDVSTYWSGAARVHMNPEDRPNFTLVSYNARDLGYNYLYISPEESQNIVSPPSPAKIKQFIHVGQSCGYPGGCNNISPRQDELIIKVNQLPAIAHIKLWKNMPTDIYAPADMVFIIEMI